MVTAARPLEARPKRAHVAERELLSILRGEVGSAERRRIVRHLLAGCPECQAIGRTYLAFADHPLIPMAIFRVKPERRGTDRETE
jgi:hypothetical protein